MSLFILTPNEVAIRIAAQVQAKRLSLNLSQQTLAERSGVSYGSLKKFERTGQIALISLLKIALSLGCLKSFDTLFSITTQPITSLDQLLQEKKRKRGRK